MNSPEVAYLSNLAARKVSIERETAAAVSEARAHGVPWSQIGAALGTSKQAAQKKYGPRSR